jgi:hypothetical protein
MIPLFFGPRSRHGSHRNFDYCFGDWTWNRFAVLFQAFEITLNGVADICHRFITRLSLRNATRQRRTFGNEHTVLVGFDCDSKFHPGSLAVGNCFAMEDRAAIPHHKRFVIAAICGDQRAAALARTFSAHSARKTFISDRNVAMRGPTPLYFFVMPLTVRLTAP